MEEKKQEQPSTVDHEGREKLIMQGTTSKKQPKQIGYESGRFNIRVDIATNPKHFILSGPEEIGLLINELRNTYWWHPNDKRVRIRVCDILAKQLYELMLENHG